MQRIEELDWLRGLMAFAILVYHCATFAPLGWSTDAASVLGRLGIYGVSIFFILSGLTLAHVYHAALASPSGIARFAVRRVFRIWPLLTLVVTIEAVEAGFAGTLYSVPLLVGNATGLFGFIRPGAYITVGAWSIGNELVYYALTPGLIFAYSKGRWIGNAVVGATGLIGLAYAFVLLDPTGTLASQWATYINPFNNLWLFAVGIALFYNLSNVRFNGVTKILAFAGPLALLILYPASGDQITIVTGMARVWLVVAATVIVVAFYKTTLELPESVARALGWLGAVSYGLYLLHPVVIEWLLLTGINSPLAFVVCVCLATIAFASAVYLFIERPFTRLGKNVAASIPHAMTEPTSFQAGPTLTTASRPPAMGEIS